MSVCANQDEFNKAFREAVKHNNKENVKEMKNWLWVYLMLWLVFWVWAVILSLQVPSKEERTLHLVIAMIAPPAYVLAHYLGRMNGKSRMKFF